MKKRIITDSINYHNESMRKRFRRNKSKIQLSNEEYGILISGLTEDLQIWESHACALEAKYDLQKKRNKEAIRDLERRIEQAEKQKVSPWAMSDFNILCTLEVKDRHIQKER